MIALVVLVVLVRLLSVLNLALVVGILRRLAELQGRIREPDTMLGVGQVVDDFLTTTVDDAPVSRDLLADGTLVGFFDPTCELCHEHLPLFVTEAAAHGGPERALAVVREGDEAAEMVSALSPAARVVLEPRRGPVARAFHLKATPAFCLLDAAHAVSAT